MAPVGRRVGMLQPQPDFFEHVEMRHAPGIEAAIAVLQIDRDATDVFAAFGGAGNGCIDGRGAPTRGDLACHASPLQQQIDAADGFPGVRAQFRSQFGVILAVAPHVVVGEFECRDTVTGFHGAQDYPIPCAALTLAV